mgnify:CR=1 FL=1
MVSVLLTIMTILGFILFLLVFSPIMIDLIKEIIREKKWN